MCSSPDSAPSPMSSPRCPTAPGTVTPAAQGGPCGTWPVTSSWAALLAGGDFDWSAAGDPADRAGSAPAAPFATAAADVRSALAAADLTQVMDTPMGPLTIGQRIAFMALDLHVHAWDVAHAVGAPLDLDPQVIAFTGREPR
jgi:hypothetical protein